jgi:DNA-dependent RNA polymerase auxiliary subunit epsilon
MVLFLFAEAKINIETRKQKRKNIAKNKYRLNTVRTRSDADIGWNQENP